MLRYGVALALVFAITCGSMAQSVRERKLLDFGWKFHLGNAADINQDFGFGNGWGLAKAGGAEGPASPDFDDVSWRTLNIPHDWVVEQPFVYGENSLHIQHGSKPVGREYPATTIGWYRRKFDVPQEDQGKRLMVEFDGVFRDSQVWLNGHLLGRQQSGYSSFSFDITDYANYGSHNLLVVRVDASQYEGWFYEGAGIYRHVWLEKTAPVHVAHWGTYVTSEVRPSDATVKIETDVVNDSAETKTASLVSNLMDPAGKSAGEASSSVKLDPWTTQTVVQTVKVNKPELWSTDTPSLYRLVSNVSAPGSNDDYETHFGIRTIAFDPDKGFLLNGKKVEIKGMCNHQDHAGVGSALPDALQDFRIEKLKEFGCNAYRTSHNPPTPELLDACDRYGILVMDENRLIGSDPWIISQLDSQIHRDRNHPSVVLWSIGNEEWEEGSPRGERIAHSMVAFVHKLDPTRPTTFAGNNGNEFKGINGVVDVRGWNYMALGDIDKYHADHPHQPIVGSEEASTLSMRGEYTNDASKGYVRAYDTEVPGWGATAEKWWTYFAARPYLAGAFVWTGFDYRGEPTPYSWPSISSYFGVLDTCGFMKDNAYYYQAWWTNNDVLHILPHWNWAGKEGQNIDVWVYSNLDEVDLLLNGKSLGRKAMPRNSHLEWQVPYAAGTLEAHGFRQGKLVKTEKVETTGSPATITLTPDRTSINADGEDVCVFKVGAADSKGLLVPVAGNDISFKVTGGTIIGVGNGNPMSHENDKFLPTDLNFNSAGWHYTLTVPDILTPYFANDYDDSDHRAISVDGQANQLGAGDSAMFRGFVDLPGIEKGSKIYLKFGSLGDHASVYVNGSPTGGTPDGTKSYTYEVEALVQPGRNTIVVVVKNAKGAGGIGGGVTVRLEGPPPVWHRTLFNGLAEVIVQAGVNPGPIILTATSGGLKLADSTIQAKQAAFRGY